MLIKYIINQMTFFDLLLEGIVVQSIPLLGDLVQRSPARSRLIVLRPRPGAQLAPVRGEDHFDEDCLEGERLEPSLPPWPGGRATTVPRWARAP
jgi:hypothetical protein